MSHHLFFEGAPPEVHLPNAGNGLHFEGPVPREGETLHVPSAPRSSNHWQGTWRVCRVAWRWNDSSRTTSADVHLLWEPRGTPGEKAKLVALLLGESGLHHDRDTQGRFVFTAEQLNDLLGAAGI